MSGSKRIFDELVRCMPEDARIEDVSIGIFWTYVRTQYGSSLSATAHRWCEDPPGALIPQAGSLCGMRVREIVPLYESASLSARALANAAVGACFDAADMTGERYAGRAQELLAQVCETRGSGLRIALVGHFHFADQLAQLGHQLDIFELEGRCEPGDIPCTRFPEFLPLADIVVMTSSTILTHAAEAIVGYSRPDAYRMIVGPTVPLHPVLWSFGFDAVCGNVIHDDAQVSRAVREGGNHRQLTGCAKYNFLTPLGRN
ncbi:MAG: hypothetical protein IKY83_06740 [Proteobacteria bacterium]|nr:hypothetical protein [Pseudomonadota bacterium]